MLQNDTLRLLPSEEALAGMLADYYRRNRHFLEWTEPLHPEEFFTENAQRKILAAEVEREKLKGSFRFYIQLRNEPDKLIGVIGLNEVVWGAFRSCFLGYKLDEAYVNRGYMTQAVELVTDYAFGQLKLHRIEGNVMPRNRQSLRVLGKCGFKNEGLAKKYLNINGVWEDHIHMVKLGPDENCGTN